MKGEILIYIGAFLPWAWGISHLFPTRSVVKGFGNISDDNRNIITMEWLTEGVALIFLGTLVAAITYIDPLSSVSGAVYIISSGCLIILAVVSLFTGFKINFLPFRLCPIIFTSSAVLIIHGWIMLK
ncbi:MAG: hypothetical protein JSV21_05265 [Nitrospirota bacterium]|nr:MAG: hypothetical protein JSV21_05265 [Nitrospirota bacterium]